MLSREVENTELHQDKRSIGCCPPDNEEYMLSIRLKPKKRNLTGSLNGLLSSTQFEVVSQRAA